MTACLARDWFFRLFGAGGSPADPEPVFTGAQDIDVLLAFSQTFHPRTVVEIGIQRGTTAQAILARAPWISSYIGVDITPESLPTLAVQHDEVPARAGELVASDPRVTVRVSPQGSRDLGSDDLPPADLIFIDGDHSEAGVLYDTELARRIVRPGGIICWHDYGNSLVPAVTQVIDGLNQVEGDHICLVEGTVVCFEIRRQLT